MTCRSHVHKLAPANWPNNDNNLHSVMPRVHILEFPSGAGSSRADANASNSRAAAITSSSITAAIMYTDWVAPGQYHFASTCQCMTWPCLRDHLRKAGRAQYAQLHEHKQHNQQIHNMTTGLDLKSHKCNDCAYVVAINHNQQLIQYEPPTRGPPRTADRVHRRRAGEQQWRRGRLPPAPRNLLAMANKPKQIVSARKDNHVDW